jgi:hypothetical protein
MPSIQRLSWLLFSVLIFTPIFMLAQIRTMTREESEGFDRQSAEEISKAREKIKKEFKNAIDPSSLTRSQRLKILAKYDHLDPKKEVPTDLLQTAILYFDSNKVKFPNQDYITVIDYRMRSTEARFFVISLSSGQVEKFHTAHGKGSDLKQLGYAEMFGNIVNSGMSSIGFVRTAEVYSGKYERSVRLDGLSTTDSALRERSVVLHGWDGVHEAPIIQGLSWGCPALDWAVKEGVIDKVKEGSLMYMGFSGL